MARAKKTHAQRDVLHALRLRETKIDKLDPDMAKYFALCQEKLGLVPNVLRAFSFNQKKLRPFIRSYDELMLEESGLTQLEREMIGVVVSSINRCFYCLVAHGWAVRSLSGDPILGEQLAINYRVAHLPARQRAMLDFAAKMTQESHLIEEADRQKLRRAGLSDADIWDVAAVAGFFNMTNRMASALDMRPNTEYHTQAR